MEYELRKVQWIMLTRTWAGFGDNVFRPDGKIDHQSPLDSVIAKFQTKSQDPAAGAWLLLISKMGQVANSK